MVIIDRWGTPLAASDDASAMAWNDAWEQALHFIGDPFATLAPAIEADETFALGSVFCAAYRVLGGLPGNDADVVRDIELAESRADADRERAHVDAVKHLAMGNFTAAGMQWDSIAQEHRDFAAVRFAHDVYLHVGDAKRRLDSSTSAVALFGDAEGSNFIAGQYAFALEELQQFAEAEQVAFDAFDADPLDLWALHALAHVYEHTEQTKEAIEFLDSRAATWSAQDGLAVHIWWHLALRLIADGQFDRVLQICDDLVPVATTPFRLSDLISILWRLELQGVDVGDRWDHVADAMADRPEWHTTGFLDLHSALAYIRRPSHRAAGSFFSGVANAHQGSTSENAEIFRDVVRPLINGLNMLDDDPAAALSALTDLDHSLHRIGGSNAQRELVLLTCAHLNATTPEVETP